MSDTQTPILDMIAAQAADMAATKLECGRLEAENEELRGEVQQYDTLCRSLCLALEIAGGSAGSWIDLSELTPGDAAQMAANVLTSLNAGLRRSDSKVRLAIAFGPAPDGHSFAVGASAYDAEAAMKHEEWLDEVLAKATEMSDAQHRAARIAARKGKRSG